LIAGGEAFANDALLDKKDLVDDDDEHDDIDGFVLLFCLINSEIASITGVVRCNVPPCFCNPASSSLCNSQ